MGDSVIELEGLCKRFGDVVALDDVSFAVGAGEIFGLLGPNGAGKSTAISCMLGALRPTAGSSRLFGLDSWAERASAHRQIGVLPSEFSFEETLTGRQVIRLFSALRGISFPIKRASELAERLHADLDRPQRELSRGNRQKIGLIQALAHDPDLVLMDEPTTGLDPLMQAEFLSILAELRAAGRSVLLSSHNLEEVEKSCDRVAMIRRGTLFEVESVANLLERAPKHVRVSVADDGPSVERLARIAGVDAVESVGGALAMRVAGDLDPLIKALAGYRVLDLEIQRPSLDDTFVSLYEEPATP